MGAGILELLKGLAMSMVPHFAPVQSESAHPTEEDGGKKANAVEALRHALLQHILNHPCAHLLGRRGSPALTLLLLWTFPGERRKCLFPLRRVPDVEPFLMPPPV